jgi:FAD/FMN-containing dehydrogenase
MKPAQIKALRKHISGTVSDAKQLRDYFATDGSVFTITPAAVVYPRATADVQALVSYAAEQAGKPGKRFSVVARGRGTNLAGAALGDGAMVVFPARMNQVLRLTKDTVTVQPGLTFGTLQGILRSHGRFLPPYPASVDFASVGGAVANNSAGEKSGKYGATAAWVKSLKVVLDDGSLIETRRLSRRELDRKKGLMTREGDLYRGIDGLLQDNAAMIKEAWPRTTKNVAGYQLEAIRGRGGSIDLTQLFVGSQGTLGLVTEITFATIAYEPRTTLVVAHFDSLEKAGEAALKLRKLQPSAMEMVDYHLLSFLRKYHPERLEGIVPEKLPQILLLVEFDNPSHFRQNILGRRTARSLGKLASAVRITTNPKEQEALWAVRRSVAAVLASAKGSKKALPIIEDACVPAAHMREFFESTYTLLRKHKLDIAVWGHFSDANFHLQPFLDLAKAKDRQLALKLMDEFYTMVIKLGGTTTGRHGDGLLRTPYLEKLYGKEVYGILKEVKQICDPQGIFNPRTKFGVTKSQLDDMFRHEYSLNHLYDHLPYT